MSILDRRQAPQTHDFSHFSLCTPSIVTLNNGVELIQFLNSQLNLIHFIFKLKAGSFFEEKKQVAAFCYLLLKESSASHNSSEVDEFLDFYGANYNVSVGIENVNINLVVPKSNCSQVLPFVFEFLAHPVFRQENLERFSKRKIMDLATNREKLGYCASQLMLSQMLGDSCTLGQILTESHLKDIDIQDIEQYHKTTFVAENITIYAAGNLDDEIISTLNGLFEEVPNGRRSCNRKPFPLPKKQTLVDTHDDCLQSSFLICKPSLAYADEERRDFQILSTLLGGYFGSRLMSNLREKNGYTYNVGCGSMYLRDFSIFYIESEVNVDVTRQAIDECYKEMKRLQDECAPAGELQLLKNYLLGQQLRRVDNTVSYMKQYSNWDNFGLKESEFELNMRAIDAFSAEKALKLARKYFVIDDFATIISGKY